MGRRGGFPRLYFLPNDANIVNEAIPCFPIYQSTNLPVYHRGNGYDGAPLCDTGLQDVCQRPHSLGAPALPPAPPPSVSACRTLRTGTAPPAFPTSSTLPGPYPAPAITESVSGGRRPPGGATPLSSIPVAVSGWAQSSPAVSSHTPQCILRSGSFCPPSSKG